MRNSVVLLGIQLVLLCAVWSPSWAQVVTHQQKIVTTDRFAQHDFGEAIDVSQGVFIAGAPRKKQDPTGGANIAAAGAVYLFSKDSSGSWVELQQLVASDRAIGDEFGSAVSIAANRAIVGAPNHDFDSVGADSLLDAGAAYILERDSAGVWHELAKLVASDRQPQDHFGSSVSIHGSYAVVGAFEHDLDSTGANTLSRAGAAYVYQQDSAGSWTQIQKLVAPLRSDNDQVGRSVSINDSWLLLGAPGEREDENEQNSVPFAGAVYCYSRNANGLWVLVQKLPSVQRNSFAFFGMTLDQSTNNALITSTKGWVNIFRFDPVNQWVDGQHLTIEGVSDHSTNLETRHVAIDGRLAVVGRARDDYDQFGDASNSVNRAGGAVVYERSPLGNWQLTGKTAAPIRAAYDHFGDGVAVDGTDVLIGAPGESEDENEANYYATAGAVYSLSALESPNYVLGKVFADTDSNCLSPSDPGLQSVIVTALPGPYYGVSTSNGDYAVGVDSGSYAVSPTLPPLLNGLAIPTCPVAPNQQAVLFDSLGQTTTSVDFGYDTIACPIMQLDVASSRRRWCFKNNTVLAYSNIGFQDAVNVELHLEMPPHVLLLSADQSFTTTASGAYIFAIDTVRAGSFGEIHLIDSVACTPGITGLTQCTRAWITPGNDCLHQLDTNYQHWDGSDVELLADCQNDTVAFSIVNTGQDMTTQQQWRLYTDTILDQQGTFQLDGGDSLLLSFAGEGQTYRLEADQHDTSPENSSPQVTIEGCGLDSTGNFSTALVAAWPTDDREATVAEECLEITSSYDPNDKQIFPTGLGANNYVVPGEALDMKIRFQNTGSDTAFRVVVVDTLSVYLDPATLTLGATSHAYTLSVSGLGAPILEFTFNDIQLPDSTTDLLGSQGFINFSIAPFDSLPHGTAVSNEAAIYFDFNLPVLTNTPFVTIHDTVFGSGSPLALTNFTVVQTDSFSICEGDSAFLASQYRYQSGIYQQLLPGIGGPDTSLVQLLEVVPSIFPQSVQICAGDSAYLAGAWQKQSGTFTDTIPRPGNCDSLIVSVLQVDSITGFVLDTLCAGDSLFAGGSWQFAAGIFFDSLTASTGCDSVVQTELALQPTYSFFYADTLCMGDSMLIGSNWQTTTGTYNEAYTTLSGCDSAASTALVVLAAVYDTAYMDICAGDSAFLAQHYQTTSGTYTDSLLTQLGCDSLVATHLTVLPIALNQQAEAICIGDSLLVHGVYQHTTGVYTDTLTGANGCDSVSVIQLTVNPIYSINDTIELCMGDSVFLSGAFQTQAGFYLDSLQASTGCDSVALVELVVYPTYTSVDSIVLCQGDSVLVHGAYQAQPDTYIDSLQTSAGCDSLLLVELLVNPSYTSTDTVELCAGDSIFLSGAFQTQTGVYADSLQTGLGCDSTTITQLVVHAPTTDVTIDSLTLHVATTSDDYQWFNCSSPAWEPVIGATNATFAPVVSGMYAVVVSLGGCVDTSSCVTVLINGVLNGTKAAQQELVIYPNPATDMVSIQFPWQHQTALRVMDVQGKIVYQNANCMGAYQLNVAALAAGSYILEAESKRGGVARSLLLVE